MASRPYTTPTWEEVTFAQEKLNARALITRTDLKGIITFASSAVMKMTKYSKEELIGSPHSIFRHPFMPEMVFREMWKNITKGKNFRGFIMNLRKDGKHYWVELNVFPINENGKIVLYSPDKIKGYSAVRKEPSREEIQAAYERYRVIRKAELLQKGELQDWEKDLLKKLDELPEKADDLLSK